MSDEDYASPEQRKKLEEMKKKLAEAERTTQLELKKVPEGSPIHIHVPQKGKEGSKEDWKMGFETMKELTRKRAEKLGVTVDLDSVKDESDLVALITTLQGVERKQARGSQGERKGSSGIATWQNEQHSREGSNEGYESYEAMIDALTRLKRLGTPSQKKEAKAVLDELIKKTMQGTKEAKKSWKIEIPPKGTTLKEMLNKKMREDRLLQRKLRRKRREEAED